METLIKIEGKKKERVSREKTISKRAAVIGRSRSRAEKVRQRNVASGLRRGAEYSGVH